MYPSPEPSQATCERADEGENLPDEELESSVCAVSAKVAATTRGSKTPDLGVISTGWKTPMLTREMLVRRVAAAAVAKAKATVCRQLAQVGRPQME